MTITVAADRIIPIRVRYPSNYRPVAGEKLPVIIWSHGGGAKTDGQLNNNEWGDALASAGYVVIHMSHIPRSAAQRDALYANMD